MDLCYQSLGANLVSVGASYDYAALGCTHHCPADIPTLNEIPNIEIIAPGHPEEFDKLFNQNYDNDKTTYFRLSTSKNNQSYNVEFGKNIIIQEKGEVVIIAVGTVLQSVLEASFDLDVTIIYCTTIKPFDFSCINNKLFFAISSLFLTASFRFFAYVDINPLWLECDLYIKVGFPLESFFR